MKIRTLMVGVTGSVLVAGSALAADPVPIAPLPVVEPARGCDTVGYVDVYGGGGFGREFNPGFPEQETRWRDLAFGGAGRAAIQCTPQFSMQLDAWGDHWSGEFLDYYYGDPIGEPQYFSRTTMGIGTHLTFHSGNFSGGVLASIGAVSGFNEFSVPPPDGTYGNIGVEAAFNTANLMVEGQIGFTPALFGPAATFGARDWYAQVRGAFYPNPNLSIGANVGVDFYSDTAPWFRRTLSWGAKVEFSPPAIPLAFYVGYEGWHWGAGFDTNYNQSYAWEHAIRVGVRLMFGADTLRELDRRVGLIDDNAIYGPAFGPTYVYGRGD